ncbi:MAG: M3 family oligoendopeptidase [Chloroflexi bacterium]|nr:M3 family oligoendopeptidase [Chloroflexota bacterium]
MPDIPAENFRAAIWQYETLKRSLVLPHNYAGLWFSEDTQNERALAFSGKMDQLAAAVENRALFFSLWWKALDEANAQRLMGASGPYRYWLEEMRHFKPYTLSEPEERVINIKDVNGAGGLQNIYEMFTNRYAFPMTIDGQEKQLTRGELMVYAHHHDPDLRAQAYRSLYKVYGDDGLLLGQMYIHLMRDWHSENVQLRGFKSPIAVRNLGNDIPDKVVETLLGVARQNAALFQRFFQLKARWLGMDKLRRYDIYAPVARSDKQFPYGQAVEMVLESFHDFDPRVAQLAERVFADAHIDAEVRRGKRSGGFCASSAPGITPHVLANYQGRADDVATLAHELGHAIHSMLAGDKTLFTFHASLPLAETASTFGELMLVDRLLGQESDPAVRRDMLFRQIDDCYATVMRQVYFALFEIEAHRLIQQDCSVGELAEVYRANLQEQFGEAVELSDEFRWEWVSIPHIYGSPFYVYAYAFGQLLVLSLYKQFKAEGAGFKPRYLQILAAGGSDSPGNILRAAGIDIASPAFWQGGFDVIREQIEELEALDVPEAV